jgi:hypothetical protein
LGFECFGFQNLYLVSKNFFLLAKHCLLYFFAINILLRSCNHRLGLRSAECVSGYVPARQIDTNNTTPP